MKVTAVAQRSGNWWAVRIPEVEGAFTQARRLEQVPDMAAEAAALLLDIDPDGVEVSVEAHTDTDQLIEEARAARDAADRAGEEASKAMRAAARVLLSEDFTVRDTGQLLGVSPQRVSQLARDLVDA